MRALVMRADMHSYLRRFELFSRTAFYATFMIALSSGVSADIIYKPLNPSFGGDPFNSSHLQGLAGIQNEYKPQSGGSSSMTDSQRFLSMLQSRLYSGLASQVADAIFGENAKTNGVITFDDQTIAFSNDGSQIELTITDLNTGQVTTIVVPTLATN